MTPRKPHISRLRSALFAGAFFATFILGPLAAPAQAALPPTADTIPRIETSADARDFFLGDPSSRDKIRAVFCERSGSSPECPAGEAIAKPYLRVEVLRGGKHVGSHPMPLTAVGTSSGSLDQKSFQVWAFQSRDNPRLAIGFHNSGPSADYTQLSILPAAKTAPTKDVLLHIDTPDPNYKVATVEVANEQAMSSLLQSPNEDSGQDAKTTSWGVTKVDVGDSGGLIGNPIKKAMSGVQDVLGDLLGAIVEKYVAVIEKLLVNDYLTFVSASGTATAQASSSGDVSPTAPVVTIWHLMRDVANIFFLLILLAIAFGNVLRLEYYAIRALLPRFVAAVVLVNLSLLIAQVLLDSVAVVTRALMGDIQFGEILTGLIGPSGAIAAAAGGVLFFGPFLLVVLTMAVLTVVALLVARIAMLWFLVATAPAAFMLAVLPATRVLYYSWWGAFWRFALIAPAMAIVLRLAAAFSESPAPTDEGAGLLRTTLIIALLFMAGTVPVLLGGRLMAGIQGWIGKRGEGLRKTTLARSRGKQAMGQIGAQMENRAVIRGAEISDALGTLTGGYLGTRGAAAGAAKFQASKREDTVGLLSIAENRRHALNMRLPEDERYAHAEKLVKAEIWGGDELSAAIESGALRHSLGASLVKEMSKAQANPFNLEHPDARIRAGAERLAALRNGVLRDYLPPKFIDEPGGLSAMQKIVMRWGREDIQKIAANQIERLPNHVRRLIALDEYDLNDLDTRRYLNFVSPEGSTELTRLMRLRAQDPQTIPVELRGIINDESRLIQYLIQWEREHLDAHRRRFEHVNYVTQRSIVRAPRDTTDWLEQEQLRRDRGAEPDVVQEEEGEAG